jgi:hypothetical protein
MSNADCGTIYYRAVHADGSLAGGGSTTTFHPGDELHVMSAALEMERASRRGVRFPPHAIGALIVMPPDVPILALLRHWLRERRRAIAARTKWQTWLAERRAKEPK